MDISINDSVLHDFLTDNSETYRTGENFMQKEVCYLWGSGSLHRFRINVWAEERVEGRYCPKNYIIDSFFVHYNSKLRHIEDKTIEPIIDLEKEKRGMFS